MKNQFFFVFLLFSGFTFSQQPTEFSFELYFEDAAGMRDTVTLGYDDYATDGIDVIFDEYNDINKAWEPNDLDVRIGDKTYSDNFGFSWLSNNTYLTKRQILNSHCLNYNKEGVWVSIQFTTKNLPMIMTWDNTPFYSDTCRVNSCLFGENTYLQYDAFTGTTLNSNRPIHIASNNNGTDLIVIDTIINNTVVSYPIHQYVENNDTIGIIQFLFRGVDLADLENESLDLKLNIYPNPVKDYLFFDEIDKSSNKIYQIEIRNLNGQLISLEKIDSEIGKLYMGDLYPGIYFIKFTDEKKHTITKRIIKL